MYWALTRSSTRFTRLIKTDAQDHRGSLDRHSHHVAALTYSMNTLLQMRMISVSHPLVYTGLSFHWTLPYWKFGFQFSSTAVMTARCISCFVFIYVVSFVLLKSGYKSDNFWTNVRDNLTKASSGRGFVMISDIWSLVPISLNFIVPLTTCCCK